MPEPILKELIITLVLRINDGTFALRPVLDFKFGSKLEP